METLLELIEEAAARTPGAPALLAPGRAPLSHGALAAQVHRADEALSDAGVARGDRVALVLENGPEAALAFLAVACRAGAAPLNPGYRAQELDFSLADLRAAAVVVPDAEHSLAARVARARGVRVLELSAPEGAPAGSFELAPCSGDPAPGSRTPLAPGPDDTALLLHTSGTTSRPKLVPLTHRNLVASAGHVAETLRLTPSDRCLNVMPLFHIHGLVAAVLASLRAGASVVCTPGFQAPRFFAWMEECAPTWYTAVPTMHRAVLERAAARADTVSRRRLRFVRSSSASLPPRLLEALEERLGAPVIEAYGMTEAAHQMTSNPLPPAPRKPGSVGVAAGPEVAVMDESGRLLPPGETGEVVIRGPNVTSGYADDPEANRRAFEGGWLRTGDQGRLDGEGYLFLTGRLKEIVNRGGEKIAPREVEEALAEHAGVKQVVCFALPDERLGETVGAAVVQREGRHTDEAALRRFAAERLAAFKVPERIGFVDEIPKGATGKLQRVGLGERLGLTGRASAEAPGARPRAKPPHAPPRDALERTLAALWSQVLELERVGIHDEFLDLGGDSVLAVVLFGRIEEELGVDLSMATLFEASTVEAQAKLLAELRHARPPRSLVTLRARGAGAPLFLVHPLPGSVTGFYAVVRHLRSDRPVHAFQARGVDGREEPLARVEDMAERYVEELREAQPRGPYLLAGHSFGGLVAFEMARRLARAGESTSFLGLIDAAAREPAPRRAGPADWAAYHLRHLRERDARGGLRYVAERLHRRVRGRRAAARIDARLLDAHGRAKREYAPAPLDGDATLFRPRIDVPDTEPVREGGWSALVRGRLEVVEVDGCHWTLVEEHPRALALALDAALAKAARR